MARFRVPFHYRVTHVTAFDVLWKHAGMQFWKSRAVGTERDGKTDSEAQKSGATRRVADAAADSFLRAR
jgi:hypothetical protein